MAESILQIRFTQLIQKKEYGGLTFIEQQELCKIAKQLEYVGVPGCMFAFPNGNTAITPPH